MSRARWETYLYPNTGVLVNKAGLQTQTQLDSFEREVTALRLAELRLDPVAPTFDLAHMQEIHRRVFQDVYQWSGDLREVNMEKGIGSAKTRFVLMSDMKDRAASISMMIHEGRLLKGPSLSQDEFASEMGAVYAALNDLHPFREGNGRMTREFMTQLAEAVGYSLDFAKVSRAAWNEAAMHASHGKPEPIAEVFAKISSSTRTIAAAMNGEEVAKRSESVIKASLEEQGYTRVEASGDRDHQYHGPIVATSAVHVAQDVGRRRAVIHDVRALDKIPSLGERLAVHFKGGVGSVMRMMNMGMEMSR